MTTGEIIQKLRLERGWSQEQLAVRVGYSHKSSINKIEHSKSDLPRAKLERFAEVFGVEQYTLLGSLSSGIFVICDNTCCTIHCIIIGEVSIETAGCFSKVSVKCS